MGALRLALALAVIGDHVTTPYGFLRLVGGTFAVQMFFVISGFYMQMILVDRYKSSANFYFSRALRIFPAYWLVALVTLMAWPVNPIDHISTLGWQAATLVFFSNAFIFLQDSLLFLGTAAGQLFFTSDFQATSPQLNAYLVIRPSWTLALELYFYLFAPSLARCKSWHLVLICMALTAVRLLAYSAGLDTDPWYYRFFPFEMPLFIIGMLLHRCYTKGFLDRARSSILAAISIVAVLAVGYLFRNFGQARFTFAMVLFLSPAIPLIFSASKDWTIDRWIGDLSYPLYLVHFPIIQWVSKDYTIVVAFSVLASIVIVALVDRPLDKWRHRRSSGPLATDHRAKARVVIPRSA